MGVKAMNCPGHMLVFASEQRSYRDLPLRLHEQTPLHRNEASGVLAGLTRVRAVLAGRRALLRARSRRSARKSSGCCSLVKRVYGDFGLRVTTAEASTRPARDSSAKTRPGTTPRRELQARARDAPAVAYVVNEGDGAFYGPKIDFDVTDAIGRKWQCATIQLDYQLPQRFDLKYIGADNAEHRPVVIHRAIFGSFERFIALLIEHYARGVSAVAGARPGGGAADCRPPPGVCRNCARAPGRPRASGSSSTTRQEKIGYKIREAQLQKVPYMLVIGDREAAEGTVRCAAARAATSARERSTRFVDATRWHEVASQDRAEPVHQVRPRRARLTVEVLLGGCYRFRSRPTTG